MTQPGSWRRFASWFEYNQARSLEQGPVREGTSAAIASCSLAPAQADTCCAGATRSVMLSADSWKWSLTERRELPMSYPTACILQIKDHRICEDRTNDPATSRDISAH